MRYIAQFMRYELPTVDKLQERQDDECHWYSRP